MGVKRRILRLEERTASEDLPHWPLEDQMAEVLDKLRMYRISGLKTGVLTDREINLLGAVHALNELGLRPGEWRLPSGVVIAWSETADARARVGWSGNVLIEDLPEGTREFVVRMDADKQPKRERWLFANWKENKASREESELIRAEAGHQAGERSSAQRERQAAS